MNNSEKDYIAGVILLHFHFENGLLFAAKKSLKEILQILCIQNFSLSFFFQIKKKIWKSDENFGVYSP